MQDVIEIGPTPETAEMRRLEHEHGLPIRDLLAARLRAHRSMHGAAKSLGISHETLRQWIIRLQMPVVNLRRRAI